MYYDRRREGRIQWRTEDFKDVKADFEADDLFRICDQLGQHGLVDWQGLRDHKGKTIDGMGMISAFGVDVIEGGASAPISITLDQSHNISVSSSSHVQIGDGNVQGISIHVQHLAEAIDTAKASPEQKAEAKGALRQFLEHPAVTTVLGRIASSIPL